MRTLAFWAAVALDQLEPGSALVADHQAYRAPLEGVGAAWCRNDCEVPSRRPYLDEALTVRRMMQMDGAFESVP